MFGGSLKEEGAWANICLREYLGEKKYSRVGRQERVSFPVSMRVRQSCGKPSWLLSINMDGTVKDLSKGGTRRGHYVED